MIKLMTLETKKHLQILQIKITPIDPATLDTILRLDR